MHATGPAREWNVPEETHNTRDEAPTAVGSRLFADTPTGEPHAVKVCAVCHSQVEDLRHTCPRCGGESFLVAGSGEEVASGLEAMQKQLAAQQHVDRGGQLFLKGRYAQAEREFRRAIEINPMNATAHANMGATYSARGRQIEAIPCLEKALELNPAIEGVPEALDRARRAATDEPARRIVGRHQKVGAWIGALVLGIAFLVAAGLQPIDGAPGYQLVTREDFSILFAFAFSFLIGALLGALLGGWLGVRAGKKRAARVSPAVPEGGGQNPP